MNARVKPEAEFPRLYASSGAMPGMIGVPRAAGKPRTVLFLQGHPSGFWSDLGQALRVDGHRVLKINFSLADRLFWRGLPARDYRGTLADWPGWLSDFLRREGVSDILYYADRHPYHVAARDAAEHAGIRTWTVEHGYLRPHWITFEPGGMGKFSAFPRDPDAIVALAETRDLPEPGAPYPHPFWREAAGEVGYHLVQSFGRPFYPRFASDRLCWPVVDYLSWLPHLALSSRRARAADRMVSRLIAEGTPFNLVALQLQADYQIRTSPSYPDLEGFLRDVLASFAAHAPPDRRLVVKIHPLDNGLGRWFARVPRLAQEHGVEDRVLVIRGGDLGQLIAHSLGVVVVNSTVGLHALRAGAPVTALGTAIYDLPGLTHQRGLDRFWTDPDRPDRRFCDAFLRALTRIQVPGSFYNLAGRRAAIAEIRRRFVGLGERLKPGQKTWSVPPVSVVAPQDTRSSRHGAA